MSKLVRKKLLLMLTICFLGMYLTSAFSANLTAQVDRSQISEGETFQLMLSVNGNAMGMPNLSSLNKDFLVISTAKSEQMSVGNGKTSTVTQWVVQLMPKHAGKIIIPALSINGQQSQLLPIEILPINSIWNSSRQPQNIFLTTAVSPVDSYIQSQFVYTVRVYYATPVQNASLSEPQAEGAIIQRLGEDRNFQASVSGAMYQVFERKYAIFPQQNGKLEIISPIFMGEVERKNKNTDLNSYLNNLVTSTQPQRLIGENLSIKVRPIPAKMAKQPWLPAQNLTMTDDWSSKGSTALTAGIPITRTITVTARGLLAEQFPSFAQTNVANVKIYIEQPELRNFVENNSIVGQRIEKITYIPNQAESIAIPSVALSWWDLNNDQRKVTTISEKKFLVQGVATSSSSDKNSQGLLAAKKSNETALTIASKQKRILAPASFATLGYEYFWPTLSFAVVIVGLIVFTVWYKPGKKHRSRLSKSDASVKQNIGFGSMMDLRRRLKQACRTSDPIKTKELLLEWVNVSWSGNPVHSIGELAEKVDMFEFKNLLHDLDRALYSNTSKTWDGTHFWHAFLAFSHCLKKQPSIMQKDEARTDGSKGLPPLHLIK